MKRLTVAAAVTGLILVAGACGDDGSSDGEDAPAGQTGAGDRDDEAVAAAHDVVIDGDGDNRTVDCDEDSVIVTGNEGDLTFTGRCLSVVVSGNDNTITIAYTEALTVEGNGNQVGIEQTDYATVSGSDNAIDGTELGYVSVSGDDNNVTWESGPDDPHDTGTGNSVGS